MRRIREALQMVPPIPRLLYLFWLVTDLDAARVATLLGTTELSVRKARFAVTSRIQEALNR